MRKFKFASDPDEYDCDEKPLVGKVYPGTHKLYHIDRDIDSMPIELLFDDFPEDWEEVTETKTVTEKPLHKDTDLGYFAGLAMQGLLTNNSEANTYVNTYQGIASKSIMMAKELIKQLDNETERY